jgi:hypothetical protein
MTNKMTFHEFYGTLPESTLRLIRKFNVSPADFDLMTDLLGNCQWADVEDHIVSNSETGMYVPRFF